MMKAGATVARTKPRLPLLQACNLPLERTVTIYLPKPSATRTKTMGKAGLAFDISDPPDATVASPTD
jgi:hypothetical protein